MKLIQVQVIKANQRVKNWLKNCPSRRYFIKEGKQRIRNHGIDNSIYSCSLIQNIDNVSAIC